MEEKIDVVPLMMVRAERLLPFLMLAFPHMTCYGKDGDTNSLGLFRLLADIDKVANIAEQLRVIDRDFEIAVKGARQVIETASKARHDAENSLLSTLST